MKGAKLSTILSLERHIRGTIAGFMTSNFVFDLPGGGSKWLTCSYDSYNEKAGIAAYPVHRNLHTMALSLRSSLPSQHNSFFEHSYGHTTEPGQLNFEPLNCCI